MKDFTKIVEMLRGEAEKLGVNLNSGHRVGALDFVKRKAYISVNVQLYFSRHITSVENLSSCNSQNVDYI